MSDQVLPGYDVTSRFVLTQTPLAPPGKCACCGAVDRPVIDFGMTLEFYGAVYLCVICLTESGKGIGLVPVTDVEKVRAELDSSLAEQLKAKDLVAISRGQYDALAVVVGNFHADILLADLSSDDLVAGEVAEAADGISDNSEPTGPGANGTTEQEHDAIVGEGPDSVSSNSGDGDDPFRL